MGPSDLINMWRALALFVAVATVQVHGGDVDKDSIDNYDVNEPAYDLHTPSYGSYSGYGGYSAPSGYGGYSAPSGYEGYSAPSGYGSYSAPYGGYSAPSGYSGGSGYGYSDLIYSGYGGHVNNAYGSPNGGFLQSGNIAPTSVYKSVAYGGGYGSSYGGYGSSHGGYGSSYGGYGRHGYSAPSIYSGGSGY